jgi:hypothetical protein
VTPDDVRAQLEALTGNLIEAGLCTDQNFPILERWGGVAEVHFGRAVDLAVTLKNIPYADAYARLRSSRAFNMCLIDGAMVQALYRFSEGRLVRHRLAFFPSPDLLEYQNNSEVYELDELYGDVIERNVVTVPVRFDYDPESAVDYDHPASHLTIGQYRNCRIPVSGAVSPFLFINFILRAFYNTPFRKFGITITESRQGFEETLTDRERRHMHVHTGHEP